MSIERYRTLMERLCAALHVDPVPVTAQAAPLIIDGTAFTLFHGGLLAPDSVVMHCVFGILPAVSRESILLRLLQTQTQLFGVCIPVFSHDTCNDSITLMCRFPLHDDHQAQATLELLRLFAAMARRWSGDHFVDD